MLLERSKPCRLESRIIFDLASMGLVGGRWTAPANPQRHSLIILQNANNQLYINNIAYTIDALFGANIRLAILTWDQWGQEVQKTIQGDNVNAATTIQVIEQYITEALLPL